MKGIALPVNAVIIIALAVMVLLMIAGFFGGGAGTLIKTELQNAWTTGCDNLKMAYNCDYNSVTEQITGADVNKDNKEDTLLEVCREIYGLEKGKIWCRNKCCGTTIMEGTECEEDIDCQFGWGRSNWHCDDTHDRCCPNGKSWNPGDGKCTT